MANGKPSIVFFGTSDVCIPFLDQLHNDFCIQLIITQPDACGGRKNKPLVSPVKQFAISRQINYLQPESLNNPCIVENITALNPQIGVVISYGKLIPQAIYSIPLYNSINVHFSLLPAYRGAAPVQRAIENGDTVTGISVFELCKKMDAGDIWLQKEFPIPPQDTACQILQTLSSKGAALLSVTITNILNQTIQKKPQAHHLATMAPKVCKHEGLIDWTLSADKIYNKFRAFYPWPGIFFFNHQKRISITNMAIHKKSADASSLFQKKPGDIIEMNKNGMTICCGQITAIDILEMKPEGKCPMSPFNFCLGNDLSDCMH
jgi:methionyl-tRNA formyltransferase